jgi:glutathione S-transferase
MASLKFWGNILSPPSRTIFYILRKFDIEHEFIQTDIPKDTRSEEYKKNVNPSGTVPVIHDEDLQIYESASIIRYLIDTYKPDHDLLPKKDRNRRAKIEELLDRNENTYRSPVTQLMVKIILGPKLFGAPIPSAEESKEIIEKVDSVFDELDKKLEGQSFLIGDNISIADIRIYNGILNSTALARFPIDKFENLCRWMSDIESDPTLSEINDEFMQAVAKLAKTPEVSPAQQQAEETKEEVKK